MAGFQIQLSAHREGLVSGGGTVGELVSGRWGQNKAHRPTAAETKSGLVPSPRPCGLLPQHHHLQSLQVERGVLIQRSMIKAKQNKGKKKTKAFIEKQSGKHSLMTGIINMPETV